MVNFSSDSSRLQLWVKSSRVEYSISTPLDSNLFSSWVDSTLSIPTRLDSIFFSESSFFVLSRLSSSEIFREFPGISLEFPGLSEIYRDLPEFTENLPEFSENLPGFFKKFYESTQNEETWFDSTRKKKLSRVKSSWYKPSRVEWDRVADSLTRFDSSQTHRVVCHHYSIVFNNGDIRAKYLIPTTFLIRTFCLKITPSDFDPYVL